MLTTDSNWPLPSQSQHVRRLLYLAEGMSIGSGLTIILLFIIDLIILLPHVGLHDNITIGSVVLFIVFFILLVRGTAFVRWGRRTSSDSSYPPEYQDWQEIRQWVWVTAVALITSGILLSISVFLWGWLGALFGLAQIIMGVAAIVGLSLYWYILYKVGYNTLNPST